MINPQNMSQTPHTHSQSRSKEQLMIVESVNTAGAVSYWRIASEIQLSALATAWTAAGLDEKLLPKAPKDEVALGRAVADMSEKRRLVRPLARRGAWAIVDEAIVEGVPPKYIVRMTVQFVDGQPVTSGVHISESEYDVLHATVMNAFASHRNMLAHHDVSSWLLDIAYGQGAVSLRESGGVYFIPKSGVDYWSKVADAVEAGGAGTVFRIPAVRTAEAVAAITDAITAEAEAAALALEEELVQTGDDALGKRDTRRRIDLCTCGQPRNSVLHNVQGLGAPVQGSHIFMPNPQPPPLPDLAEFHRIHALRLNGVWVAEVYGAKMGRGQAVQWMDAVNAALEDLKEKTS